MLDRLRTLLWISRTIRNYNSLKVFVKEIIIVRDPDYRHTPVHKVSDDAVLAAAVHHYDSRPRLPVNSNLLRGHGGDQVRGVRIAKSNLSVLDRNPSRH